MIHAATAGKEEYNLSPFFYDRLTTEGAVEYRHDVMRDLERPRVVASITSFANRMRLMREQIARANKLNYKYQKERWFLHAAETHCTAVRELRDGPSGLSLSSRGLIAFRDYVTDYSDSEAFALSADTAGRLADGLAAIHYSVLVRDTGFKVRQYDSERDYSTKVEDAFRKFRQGGVKNYRAKFRPSVEMNHVEAKVLGFVALLHPEAFSRLEAFRDRHAHNADRLLTEFDREIQFYVAYCDDMSRLKGAGLAFCYPRVSAVDKTVHDKATFDLALATKLVRENVPVVCNDIDLFTHFERQADSATLDGKPQDDLLRIHGILERATSQTVIIMNEMFNSTTLQDAVFLARMVMNQINDLDALCVCVTFLDELASLSEKTVSMTSTVLPDDPASRTYKVVRRPADGRAYAISIAERYRLTYDRLTVRLGPGAPRAGNGAKT